MHSPLRSRETPVIVALAVFAALRVATFSAAFPFFSNVDEHRHVDAVLKYSQGYLPTPENRGYEPEMGRYLGLYGSPEYQGAAGELGVYRAPPPPWERSPAAMLRAIERGEAFLAKRSNLESSQPPVYYLVAGAWLRAGQGLGLSGAQLLYWVRALSALIVLALILCTHRFLGELYPDDALLRLGVPLLLAVFPMDAFFYVTRDALSPLLGGVGFFLALRVARRSTLGRTEALGLGVLLAAAFLAKYTNVVLVAVAAICSAIAWRRREDAPQAAGSRLLAMWGLAALVGGAWLLRNQLVFGDPTGTAYKVERMGWAPATWASVAAHPLFSGAGLRDFVGELVPLFWRGELVWHRVPLASRFADGLYLASTLLFVGLAAIGLRVRERPAGTRLAESLALVSVLASVAVLALLSLLYVFHETSNPSASRPYFVQGRLISGVLVPFLLIYVRGIEVATSRLPEPLSRRAAWAVLVGIAAVALLSELALHRPIFRSAYNWFHLP